MQQSSPTLPTHQTLPTSFFHVPKDEIEAQGVTLKTIEIQTVLQNVIKMLTQMTSRSPSNQGNPTGITVPMPEGTTLKGMGVNRNSGKCIAECD
jgi:hypothetical protein